MNYYYYYYKIVIKAQQPRVQRRVARVRGPGLTD